MSHGIHDAVGRELARRIAEGLAGNPQWIDQAKGNLVRWAGLNADAPGLLRCYQEWSDLLERPVSEVRQALLAETDEGQRLRQNSPFAGVLSPEEVWEIKRRVHEAAPA